MKKILFYIYSMSKGGAERVLSYLLEDLSGKYDVTLLTDAEAQTEYTVPEGVTRIVIGEYPGGGMFAPLLRKTWRQKKIREAYRLINPDIAVGFMGKNAVRLLTAVRGEKGRKIAAIRMNPVYEFGNGLRKKAVCRIFKKADGIVCQNFSQKLYFPGSLGGRIEIIKNPIGREFCRQRYTGERPQRIVSVGRLDENKNHQMLIRAFAKVREHYPQAELVIYGEGDARRTLEKLTEELGLRDSVSLPGITQHVADNIYHAAVYVMCSVSEGMPNALIEAMALGLAVVSTDFEGGGASELICDGENGMLIPINDTDMLADRLTLLLGDEELRERIGSNASKLRGEYGRERIIDQWEAVLTGKCDGADK